jgi:RNA polymerase sigma-70 factor (ECF subfamily)
MPDAPDRAHQSEIRSARHQVGHGMWDASDEALLAGYATGDGDAATVFVRRFQSKVVGLARLITRDRGDAEEVAQDAFVRAWRYAASYDPRRGAVVGWLLGITRNVALDRVRVSERRAPEVATDPPLDLAIDAVDETGEAVSRRDDVARVAASLRSLPDEQRRALVAVTLLGLSTREHADAAGVPLGTAKTRVRLGLRKVRDRMGALAE